MVRVSRRSSREHEGSAHGLLPTVHVPAVRAGLRCRRSRGHRGCNRSSPRSRSWASRWCKARRIEDAEIAVQTDAAIGCMVVDWGKKGLEGKTAALINLMRRRGLEMPIIMLVRRKRFEDIPVEVLDYHRRLCLPRRGDAGIHRQEPRQPAQAICRDAEDAVLRRAGRLRRGRQPALDLPRPQWRHLLQPQPDRPHLRRASRRGGVPRRSRQFGARARRPPDP